MTTVPYTDSSVTNLPSSFDTAQSDDFFGFGNAMQAIASITPKYRNPDGSVQQPTQIVSVSSGNAPPNLSLDSSGGTFFDLRSQSEIFASMDAILNEHREKVLNSPQTLKMLGQQ
ncbi:unnamed protein product [Adineta steineri]|uniref:Uncharacterized protein n=1 Tax=Adineta steineri TaxID=433720 RepID=A0A815L405_9BILA|nr:unnamed protein product [Adineta steineri]CAF1614226.1 unnamed protein product [Adineta steineri]